MGNNDEKKRQHIFGNHFGKDCWGKKEADLPPKDPLARLAHFKELQARYAAVKEQRERAESTNRILQQMPTAGTEET